MEEIEVDNNESGGIVTEANLEGISIYDQQQLIFEGCACLQLQS